MKFKKTGLYIHIPFCEQKCKYCSFYSKALDNIPEKQYLSSLFFHLDSFKLPLNKEISTIYFGGGTPSLMSCEFFYNFLNTINSKFKITKNIEVTVELNPEHITKEYLFKLKNVGVNRISIGTQSFNNSVLKNLNRIHSAEKAKKAIELALTIFDNVSCDFIIGIKGADNEIEYILDYPLIKEISHLSLYILEGDKNKNLMFDSDLTADTYMELSNQLELLGFSHYEISNFAKSGFESKHNSFYWEGEEYIGLGPSAHSLILSEQNPLRIAENSKLDAFLDNRFLQETTEYEYEDFVHEMFMLGLRLKKGINLEAFKKKYNMDVTGISNKLCQKFSDFINVNDTNISLTKEGFLLSNEIFQNIV